MPLFRRDDTLIDVETGDRALGKHQFIAEHMVNHIECKSFPCVIGKTAIANDAFHVGVYSTMHEEHDVTALYNDIKDWLNAPFSGEYRTFLAGFAQHIDSHDAYHDKLFKLLWKLRSLEPERRDMPQGISDDIHAHDFAFSVHRHAFFIVGLSPTSPRLARRTTFPGLAFNLHSQFENLRAVGKMGGIEKMVRKRDSLLQGGINPLLAAHGHASAAMQYSGKVVTSTAQCPYRH